MIRPIDPRNPERQPANQNVQKRHKRVTRSSEISTPRHPRRQSTVSALLHSATAADIADLLFHLVRNEQMAVVATTHQATLLTKATRTATPPDGALFW